MSDTFPTASLSDEEIAVCYNTAASIQQPIFPLDSYSSFNHVKQSLPYNYVIALLSLYCSFVCKTVGLGQRHVSV